MGAAVAAIAIKERHMVDSFKRAGALSENSARTPDELSIGTHSLAWRILLERAFVRDAGEGRFYLDAPSWDASRRVKHRRLMIVLLIVIAVALWFAVTANR